MEYENRPPPEGINVTDQHPLADFAWMLATVALLVTVLVITLSLSAGWLARQVPMAQENRWAAAYLAAKPQEMTDAALQTQRWLQDLADTLSLSMDLEPDMVIQVHYVENDEVINAFATLGGHVVIYSGLVKAVHSENAVAMVLAHEIAHIKHRDPITALGRGAAVALGLSAIGGASDSAVARQVLGNIGMLTGLSFSRGQEYSADEQAVAALLAHYGHLNGATELFEKLKEQQFGLVPEFLSTHPLSENRIARLRQAWQSQPAGNTTALPEWLVQDKVQNQTHATPLSPSRT